MECTTWTEEDWKTLIYTIQRGKCLLMLGPDAATEIVDGQTYPLTSLLAQDLAGRLPQDARQYLDPLNLAQVAQYYRIERGSNDLEARVCEFYDDRWTLTSELHRHLAALPFHLTISTTPDNLLCEALRAQGKEPIIARYHYRGVNPKMVPMGSVQTPLVFYLYGTADEPESLVLTENNLIDFLTAVITGNPALPNNILSELRDRDKSLLFLGFGFKHWYLRILLHVLQGREKESRSFALEQYTPRNIEEFQRTTLFFKTSDYKITICAKELPEFVQELRERYEQSTQSPTTHAQDAPVVLLCGLRCNLEAARPLREQIANAGFNVWLPEDDQPLAVEQLTQTEFCVVIQSPALTSPATGSFDVVRMRQQREEVQGKWDLFSQKLTKLEKDRILETQTDEQFRLDNLIAEIKAERQQLEQQLLTAESQTQTHDAEHASLKATIRLALERQQQAFRGFRYLIPVNIEPCAPLEELTHLPAIEVSEPDQIAQLISALKRDLQRRKRRG